MKSKGPDQHLPALFELAAELLGLVDTDGHLRILNGAWRRTLGFESETLEGRALLDLLHPEDHELARSALGEPEETRFEARVVTQDGGWRNVVWSARRAPDGWLLAGRDLTDQRTAEARTAASEEHLAEAQAAAGFGTWLVELGSDEVWWSPEQYRIYGQSPEHFRPTLENATGLTHREDRQRLREYAEVALSAERPGGSIEYRIVRGEDQVRTLNADWRVLRDPNGTPVRIMGTVRDVTEERAAAEALRENEERLRTLFEQVPAIVYTAGLGVEGEWTYVSPRIESMLGYAPDEWIARPRLWFQSVHPDDRVRVLEDEDDMQRTGFLRSEYRLRARDGRTICVRDEATLIMEPSGAPGMRGVMLDVTEARHAAASVELAHDRLQAIIDNSPLVIFAKDPEQRFLFANREFEQLWGLVPGQAIGRRARDFAPPEVAERLEAADRLVLELGESVKAEDYVERHGVRRTYLAHRFPLVERDGEVGGMAVVAVDITERAQREEALRDRLEWSARIHDAITNERFTLHAQPIVELATGNVVQEELLIRMLSEEPGVLVPPSEFLPQAERFGLAPAIDRWVIGKAVELARTRRVEVNLSAQSIVDASLHEFVETCLERAGGRAENIVFEITETAAASDIEQARRFAERLRALGCGFALDDFGTGYGSFTYLKHLPVQYLKIDIEFVRDLHSESSDTQVVTSIVDVARNFGMRTIAEGVEQAATLDLLTDLGVDFAQGFHLGRPEQVQLTG